MLQDECNGEVKKVGPNGLIGGGSLGCWPMAARCLYWLLSDRSPKRRSRANGNRKMTDMAGERQRISEDGEKESGSMSSAGGMTAGDGASLASDRTSAPFLFPHKPSISACRFFK